jgi:hypothetical protein
MLNVPFSNIWTHLSRSEDDVDYAVAKNGIGNNAMIGS